MYLRFFGLNEKPFAITPDPRYLYLSERHAEALAHLLYGINESGGFIQLTGEVGTGKTTVVRTLLSRVPHHADVAVILNPRVTPVEFLLTICEELGLEIAEPRPRQRQADGRCVESAAAGSPRRGPAHHRHGGRSAEPIRRSPGTGASPDQSGNPHSETAADHSDRPAGASRVARPHGTCASWRSASPAAIIWSRCRARRRRATCVTGCGSPALPRRSSPTRALTKCTALAAGIPRVINVACDRALLGAYTQETRKVTAALVRRAAGEVYGRRFLPPWFGWLAGALAIAGFAGVAFLAWQFWQRQLCAAHAAVQPTAAAGVRP